MSSTASDGFQSLVANILEAGLSGNHRKLELLCINAVRKYKSAFPDFAKEISSLLAKYSAGASLRGNTQSPAPSDIDVGLSLLRISVNDDASEPILDPSLQTQIERFLQERIRASELIAEGYAPPGTILLKGPPGTGKTMLAEWLAKKLNLNFVTLDLSVSISSFLGKTGNNLRRSLDYARNNPCLFLLDEFDAIGKRRDDPSEIGELKRIVNVLLKELENWPIRSVLVAATNHPELLDPAIHRRFDLVINVPLPGVTERAKIIEKVCGRFAELLPKEIFLLSANLLEGMSGSELETMTQAVVRHHVIEKIPFHICFMQEIGRQNRTMTDMKGKDFVSLIEVFSRRYDLSVREIATLTGVSPSKVQYHLKREREKNVQ